MPNDQYSRKLGEGIRKDRPFCTYFFFIFSLRRSLSCTVFSIFDQMDIDSRANPHCLSLSPPEIRINTLTVCVCVCVCVCLRACVQYFLSPTITTSQKPSSFLLLPQSKQTFFSLYLSPAHLIIQPMSGRCVYLPKDSTISFDLATATTMGGLNAGGIRGHGIKMGAWSGCLVFHSFKSLCTAQ